MMHTIKNRIRLIALGIGFLFFSNNVSLEASSSLLYPLSLFNKFSFFNKFSREKQKILTKFAYATHTVSLASIVGWMLLPGIVTPTFLGGSLIGSYLLQRHLDTNKLATKIDDVDNSVNEVKNKVQLVQATADRIEKATNQNSAKLEVVDKNVVVLREELTDGFATVTEQVEKNRTESNGQFTDIKATQKETNKSINDFRGDYQDTKAIVTQIEIVVDKIQLYVQNVDSKCDSLTKEQQRQMASLEQLGEKSKQRRRKNKKEFADMREKQGETHALLVKTDEKLDSVVATVENNNREQQKNTETLVATTMGILGAVSTMYNKQEEIIEADKKKRELLDMLLRKQEQAEKQRKVAEDAQKAFELQAAEVLNANSEKLDILCEHLIGKSKSSSFDNVEDVSATNLLSDWQMQTGKSKIKNKL